MLVRVVRDSRARPVQHKRHAQPCTEVLRIAPDRQQRLSRDVEQQAVVGAGRLVMVTLMKY